MPSNIPPAAVPLLRGEWLASSAELGWVSGAHLAGYSLAVLFVLPLSDRFRPWTVIVGGAVLSVVASVAFALLATDVVSAIVLRLLAGAGLAGVYMPGVRVVAATAAPGRRGFDVGLFVASFYLGSAVSFLYAGSWIAAFGDWRGAALSSGAISALAVALGVIGARGLPAAGGRARLDIGVIRNGPLVRTIAAYSGHAWELFAVRAWLAAFLSSILVSQGASAAEATGAAGQWTSLILAFGIPAVFLGGWLSDRAGRVPTAMAAALASGTLAMVLGTLAGVPWPLLVAVACLQSALMAADSAVYSTTVTELVPAARLGSAQAIQAFSGFALGAIGPAASGLALDLGWGYVGAFTVGGVASLLAAVPLIGMRSAARRPAEAGAV